jgi:hypothetical protein
MHTNAHYSLTKELNEEQVNNINTLLEKYQDDLHWQRRTSLGQGRSVDYEDCAYDFMGHNFMPEDLKKYLLEVAPKVDGYFIGELCINRYREGDYIGKHKDRAAYRMNRVIALQEKGDGIYIDDDNKFIEDVQGQAVTIHGVGPVHSVPPAKNKRHVFIVLYE